MEVRTIPATGPVLIALAGSAQDLDTAELLDQLTAMCGEGDAIVDLTEVVVVTSTLFGVLQAVAGRQHRTGHRLIAVAPGDDYERLRGMRMGREFDLSGSVDNARWELQRPPSRFKRA
ncbi:MAG: hypothetical protein JHC95_02935 [Solirubrobacteraceae bacterium]|nr:hypothetical protein [Solirubrobacteraceae bacterium]